MAIKIKRIGNSSFTFSFDNIEVLTDPLSYESAVKKLPKTEADVIITSAPKYYGDKNLLKKVDGTIEPKNKEEVFDIASPGDYEIGEVIIRRPINTDFYILDQGDARIVYMGEIPADFSLVKGFDFGDVDVLIAPLGGIDGQPSYDMIQKILNDVDPTYLIPSTYTEDSQLEGYKTHFGFANIEEMGTFKLTSGAEVPVKVLQVKILS